MSLNVGIFGATGAVGQEMLACLEKSPLKNQIGNLTLMASERSAGRIMDTFLGKTEVQEVNGSLFEGLDYAFFSAGASRSKEWAPIANKAGVRVIDNSSAFRNEPEIPLVVPEINAQVIGNSMLIANPNCTTAIAAVVLHPIYKRFGLRKVIASTYQSVSGAGAKGMQELLDAMKAYHDGKDFEYKIFQHPIHLSIIPHIDTFQTNGYTKEEMKFVREHHKIFGDDSLDISCTCVRIPVLRCHSEAITIETIKDVTVEEVKELLSNSTGIELVDNTAENLYPLPITATGKNNVEVGRIRQNLAFKEKGLDLFVSGDQLLRGAAYNAVRILESVVDNEK